MKLKYTPIILFLLINILFDKSYASSFFLEDFNNSYSYSNVWTEYKYSNDDINFNEYPGSISLRSNSYNFPMITSSNIFPESNNFDLSFLFQYRQIGNQFGTGIVISDNKPVTYPYINTSSNSMFQVWQDGSNNLNYAATIIPKTGIPYTYISGFYIFHKTSLGKDSPHTINLKLINNKYYFYVDNVLLYESQETNRRPNSIWFGNPVQVNQLLGWHNLSIDYIKINKLPDKELDVPYFSQNDSQWGSDTYDHMTETIDQKGCAMTSAAMLLNYYGIDVTPNNDPMNPKTLNEWLINKIPQEGLMGNAKGYTLDGGINWIAVNQLARFFDPELTFYMFNGNLNQSNNTFPVFTSNINNNIPEILWISGNGTYWDDWSTHFIVGKGYDTENAYLNDPEDKHNSMPLNYEVKRRMAFYQDPNWDDWGTISITYPKQIALVLKDKQGKKLGKDLENNIYQEIDNSVFVEGNMYGGNFEDTHNTLFLSKVELEAQYQIEVKSMESNDFKLEYNSLNTDNSAYVSLIEGNIAPNQINTYQLDFKNNAENSLKLLSIQKPQPDFDSIKKLIKDNKDKFKNKGIYNLLLTKINLAEFFYNHSNPKVVTIMLDFIIQTIEKPSKIIDENFRLVLLNAIWELKSLL